jgi:hypothetical protein
MRRYVPLILGVGAALTLFWIIDTPATVRVKVAILKMLPMERETLNRHIQALCAGAHAGLASASCYTNFNVEEPIEELQARVKCREFSRKVQHDKSWQRQEPNASSESRQVRYAYVGTEKEIGEKYGFLMFFPESCTFSSLNKGKITTHGF